MQVAFEQRNIGGRTQAFDDAMDDGDEERRLIGETMVERALRNSGASRDRFDTRGAVAVRQEQMRGSVENPLA
ncbi:MAG: hypothetical protein ABI541_03240 [Betaproteobacteria bacterium]